MTCSEFFRDNDWDEMTGGAPDGWLDLAGVRVPFVSMNNEPESTDPAVLRARYARALGRLLELRRRHTRLPHPDRAARGNRCAIR